MLQEQIARAEMVTRLDMFSYSISQVVWHHELNKAVIMLKTERPALFSALLAVMKAEAWGMTSTGRTAYCLALVLGTSTLAATVITLGLAEHGEIELRNGVLNILILLCAGCPIYITECIRNLIRN